MIKRATEIKTRFIVSIVSIHLFFLLTISSTSTQLTNSILLSIGDTGRIGLTVNFMDFALQKGLLFIGFLSLTPFVLIFLATLVYSMVYHYKRFSTLLFK